MDLGIKKKDFRGIKFEELPLFEELFKVNINIFRLNEEKMLCLFIKADNL